MEPQNGPRSLPIVNANATVEQMVQLREEGATFEAACKNLQSESLGNILIAWRTIRQLLDNAHQPLDPNMTDKEPHMGKASLAEQEEEGKNAWNDKTTVINSQALEQRAANTRKIDEYIMTNFFPTMMAEVGNKKVAMLVPYHTRQLDELVVTGRLDTGAWQAAHSGVRESTTDLPIEALRADVDQPAHEIISLCSRVTDDIIALETAALRRDTAKILEVLARIGQEMHGIETLAKVQRAGLEGIETDENCDIFLCLGQQISPLWLNGLSSGVSSRLLGGFS
ncbi:hypothetical protein PILCRDRAFT_90491 [Piloderma croceum F 1598]|uniref:Uncharacterized protein n=1 Tax=Piloderma croceum (strain F 1598) TaxID=765440 RepID=A0A0C3F1T8_PILCF|nr:hypothetical protein PILCRDRAFT_90491 [Piloderma croceum F 1598]